MELGQVKKERRISTKYEQDSFFLSCDLARVFELKRAAQSASKSIDIVGNRRSGKSNRDKEMCALFRVRRPKPRRRRIRLLQLLQRGAGFTYWDIYPSVLYHAGKKEKKETARKSHLFCLS